jgi:hypothetical protein
VVGLGVVAISMRRNVMNSDRARIAGASAVVLAMSFAVMSLAATSRITDPPDTPGPLDVRLVRFAHPRAEPPNWTVITASSWTVGSLWDRGYVFVQLDTYGGEPADHYALIRSDGLTLRADLFEVAKGAGRDVRLRSLTVWRKANDSVSVKIPLKAMSFGPLRTYYRWWVVTSLTSEKCPRGCLDRAPDEGSIQQWRPGMSPTPSPTVSPSPTGSPSPTVTTTATAAPVAG